MHSRSMTIDQIDTDYLTTNPASGRILTNVGFVDRGEYTCYSLGSGQSRPSRRMVLTRTRYLEHKAETA